MRSHRPGAYVAIHALNAASAGTLAIPVSLIPLVGGLAGLASPRCSAT